MRNISKVTPPRKTGKPDETPDKKLKQARLPFKILPPGKAAAATDSEVTGDGKAAKPPPSAPAKEGGVGGGVAQKRKFIEDAESDGDDRSAERSPSAGDSKENAAVTSKKKKKCDEPAADAAEVIVLDDEDDDEAEPEAGKKGADSQEATTKAKPAEKKGRGNNKRNSLDKSVTTASPKTPLNTTTRGRKGAGTPQSAGGSAGKVQIKIPFGSASNKAKAAKRRKSTIKGAAEEEGAQRRDESLAESSDDIEVIADELNPQKRQRVEEQSAKAGEKKGQTKEDKKDEMEDENKEDIKMKGVKKDDTKKEAAKKDDTKKDNPKKEAVKKDDVKMADTKKDDVKKGPLRKDDLQKETIKKATKQDEKKSNEKDTKKATPKKVEEAAKVDKDPKENDVAADDVSMEEEEEEDKENKDQTVDDSICISDGEDSNDDKDKSSSAADETDAPPSTGPKGSSAGSHASKRTAAASTTPVASLADRKKNLTPKQMKLMEQRRKLRDEKERKLMDERLQKQREKEEKDQAKKREREEREEQRRREREEKDEQRRREREEKDEQRRREREEKEQKRLAEVEAKRKKTEAKEEELRKKEEERKRKEQEKEEADMKKKKVAESFKKWFRPSAAEGDAALKKCSEDDAVDVDSLAFRPFQVRADMNLAPIRRRVLSDDSRDKLEALFAGGRREKSPVLYLEQLRRCEVLPRKWRRPSTEAKLSEEDADEVMIIEDELAGAGQAIVEEAPVPVERMRAKFYKFSENRRPAYHGTWRKKTNLITPRRPFAQDTKFFDYEVDSDLEWEEEEPGESLDGSDDDKEKESEDDDYEVDNEWFVPHGHLSDEELQNEDEFGMEQNNDRETQKAKLKILQQEFAQEMKKKTEKIKPRLIGCLWVDENGNQPELCPKIIWDSLNTRAALFAEPPLLEEPEQPERPEPEGGKPRPATLTEPMLRDLVRLVHGNVHNKMFLIKEFIASMEAKQPDSVSPPLKSTVREKIDEFAEWKVLDAEPAGQATAAAGDSSKKKKIKKRLCWVVGDEVLKRMQLDEELSLDNNTWQYTLTPKFVKDASASDAAANLDVSATSRCETPSTSATATKGQDSEKKPTKASRRSLPAAASPEGSAKKAKKSLDITKFTKVLSEAEQRERSEKLAASVAAKKGEEKQKEEEKKKEEEKNKEEESKPSTPAQKATKTTASPKGSAGPPAKKRVPLLMSVARGEQISQPTKNALISQFLKSGAKSSPKSPANNKTQPPPQDNEVIELD